MSFSERETRAILSQAAGLEVLRRAAPVLAAQGIELMPLKGLWLQVCVYRDRASRVISDVDVLVRERDFAPAIAALVGAGFRSDARNASEASLTHPELLLPLDLHCRLFLPGAFRLPTDVLFARSVLDRLSFPVEVMSPDPLDVFAHLIGHFVKSRTPPDDGERLADFPAIARRYAVAPEACAARMSEAGMARAARYVLAAVATHEHDHFSDAVIAELPPDPIGTALARCADLIAARGLQSSLAALPGFMLERSLLAGGLSLGRRVLDRARAPRVRVVRPM